MTNGSELGARDLWRALRSLWLLPLLGAVFALALVPWHATLDSAGYLTNARVLVDESAVQEHYLLIREPGFPLFIRLVWEVAGTSDLAFLAAQGGLAGLAVALAAAVFPELGGRRVRLACGVLTLLAPVYLVYSGMVLQQIGMAVMLSAVCLVLRWVTVARGTPGRPLAVLALLFCVAAYWAAVFIYVAALVAACLLVWWWRMSRAGLVHRAVAALVVCVAVLPWLAMQPWVGWKSDVASQRAGQSQAVSLDLVFKERIVEGVREEPLALLETRAVSALALLQVQYPLRKLGADPPSMPGFLDSEDLMWARWMALPEARCGILDVTQELRQPVVSSVELHCRPASPMAAYASLSEAAYLYGALASLVLLGVTVWAAVRRPAWLVVLCAPWAWLAVYTLAGGAIDRYAVPVWPLKVYLLTVLLVGAVTRVRQWPHRAPAASSAGLTREPSRTR